ncbi:MAG: hypothetical protein LBH44_02375 [Treponema sp.]|nr:hypothetical protein [Treponema sp.]
MLSQDEIAPGISISGVSKMTPIVKKVTSVMEAIKVEKSPPAESSAEPGQSTATPAPGGGSVPDQDRPRLAILPFPGASGGDSESIALLFSIQDDLRNAFTIVPRNDAVNAAVKERGFQTSLYVDSGAVSRIGKMVNADYVLSGYVRRQGNSNLLVSFIIKVDTFELTAGDFRLYRSIEDIPAMLPSIAGNMAAIAKQDRSKMPSLTFAPFRFEQSQADAEALAQLLPVAVANTGRFAVLPSTSHAGGFLSAEALSMGGMNMLVVQIRNSENGSQLAGESLNYRLIDDGIAAMPQLAESLAGKARVPVVQAAPAPVAQPTPAPTTAAQPAPAAAEPAVAEPVAAAPAPVQPAPPAAPKEKPDTDASRLWAVGASVGTSFSAPWFIGTVQGTIAPVNNLFLEIGVDFGLFTGYEDEDVEYYSLYPFAHVCFYMPFSEKIGLYAGAGGGFMYAAYTFPEGEIDDSTFALDVCAGAIFLNMWSVSYTLRTNFESANNKVAVGFVYRF